MKLFVDTNIFILHLTQTGNWKVVGNLLEEHELYTSVLVLNELRYKLLWQEASEMLGSTKKYDIQKKIKTDDALRKKVYSLYLPFYFSFKHRGTILPVIDDEEMSCIISQQYGLLPADADIIASMRREGLTTILTTDNDFKTVSGIRVIQPEAPSK